MAAEVAKRAEERRAGGGAGSRGRPRDPAIEAAILDATIRLLASAGVEGTSVEKVASDAGTSKVTVYTRFRSKSELIGAALARLQIGDLPAPTGDPENDLVALLAAMRRQYAEVGGMSIIGTCLTAEAQSGEFLDIVRASTLHPRRAAFAGIVRHAIETGEFRPGTDVERTVSLIIGAFYADYLAGVEMGEDWDRSVVKAVLDGARSSS
ncbi:TetR/AcrR family transcriptional regulator [Amycolatopsis sp. VC5-11]|uniref:TetR/AcrR family transcriptional regulator n=1 Tax=Amycolatopsis sp. VC5-11 TaxID=3120156 RepID=UPI003008B493